MSAKELTSEIYKTLGKELDMNLEHLEGTKLDKKLIKYIEDYGDLQWRLANAHREMFNSK